MEGKWPWVKAGIALGIRNIIIFLSGNTLGTATFYAQTTGYLTSFIFPDWIPMTVGTEGTCGNTVVLAAG